MRENVAVVRANANALAQQREGKTGAQVTNQWGQADLLEQQAQAKGKGNPDSFNHNSIPLSGYSCCPTITHKPGLSRVCALYDYRWDQAATITSP